MENRPCSHRTRAISVMFNSRQRRQFDMTHLHDFAPRDTQQVVGCLHCRFRRMVSPQEAEFQHEHELRCSRVQRVTILGLEHLNLVEILPRPLAPRLFQLCNIFTMRSTSIDFIQTTQQRALTSLPPAERHEQQAWPSTIPASLSLKPRFLPPPPVLAAAIALRLASTASRLECTTPRLTITTPRFFSSNILSPIPPFWLFTPIPRVFACCIPCLWKLRVTLAGLRTLDAESPNFYGFAVRASQIGDSKYTT